MNNPEASKTLTDFMANITNFANHELETMRIFVEDELKRRISRTRETGSATTKSVLIMEELDNRKHDEPSAAALLAETVNGGYLDKHTEQKKRLVAFMDAPPTTTRVYIVVYYQQQGGHTHMRVFSGYEGSTRGKAGDLCMTNEEFAAFREQSEGAARSLGGCIEFKEER